MIKQTDIILKTGVPYLYPFNFDFMPLCIQMLHMATESEVIQKLRYQVDNYDEQQELLLSSDQLSKEIASDPHQHVQLCSPATNQTTTDAYNITLHREHGITDFLESLSLFFQKNNWE